MRKMIGEKPDVAVSHESAKTSPAISSEECLIFGLGSVNLTTVVVVVWATVFSRKDRRHSPRRRKDKSMKTMHVLATGTVIGLASFVLSGCQPTGEKKPVAAPTEATKSAEHQATTTTKDNPASDIPKDHPAH
jgi:hypothetical protein